MCSTRRYFFVWLQLNHFHFISSKQKTREWALVPDHNKNGEECWEEKGASWIEASGTLLLGLFHSSHNSFSFHGHVSKGEEMVFKGEEWKKSLIKFGLFKGVCFWGWKCEFYGASAWHVRVSMVMRAAIASCHQRRHTPFKTQSIKIHLAWPLPSCQLSTTNHPLAIHTTI